MAKHLSIFILFFINISCSPITKLAFKSIGVFDTENKPVKLQSDSRKLYFLPMHHIGTQEFYDHTKYLVDSLHKEEYIVFFEKVTTRPDTDSTNKDLLKRKLRKCLGTLQPDGGYLDTINGTFNGKSFRFLKTLKNQPFGPTIGLDSTIDMNVDFTINELIAAFEKKFGPILLEECDKTTPLKERYRCSKIKSKEQRDFITLSHRNEFLAQQIMQSPHKKIAVMYGARHFGGLYKNLQNRDSTWKKL